MDTKHFCQSCSMPLDSPASRGTEKYGSLSLDYCKYCYKDGAFTNPDMTVEEMASVVKTEMGKKNMDAEIIAQAVNILPHLKRWKSSVVTA